MKRVCDSVLVLCAPDGVSVVGTIVVGANVGDDVVGASVGIDVVGANVGMTAEHTHSHPRRCSAGACCPHGEVSRVPPPAHAVPPHGYS